MTKPIIVYLKPRINIFTVIFIIGELQIISVLQYISFGLPNTSASSHQVQSYGIMLNLAQRLSCNALNCNGPIKSIIAISVMVRFLSNRKNNRFFFLQMVNRSQNHVQLTNYLHLMPKSQLREVTENDHQGWGVLLFIMISNSIQLQINMRTTTHLLCSFYSALEMHNVITYDG